MAFTFWKSSMYIIHGAIEGGQPLSFLNISVIETRRPLHQFTSCTQVPSSYVNKQTWYASDFSFSSSMASVYWYFPFSKISSFLAMLIVILMMSPYVIPNFLPFFSFFIRVLGSEVLLQITYWSASLYSPLFNMLFKISPTFHLENCFQFVNSACSAVLRAITPT